MTIYMEMVPIDLESVAHIVNCDTDWKKRNVL